MKARTRIRLAARAVASTMERVLGDVDPASDERMGEIRARLASSPHRTPEALGAHYVGDVTLLLVEVDRLRYDMGRTPR